MPRQKNTKPTNIYWLFDTRTGIPFYCGKTIQKPRARLNAHRWHAANFSGPPLYAYLLECGDSVRVDLIEVVPSNKNWAKRERFWIAELRRINPDCVNVSDGGDGTPGLIQSEETKRKIGDANRRNMTADARSAIRARMTGTKRSEETRAKQSAAKKGRTLPEEHRLKIGESLRLSYEEGRRDRANPKLKGKKRSVDVCSAISAGQIGRVVTEETRAKLREASKQQWLEMNPETRTKISSTWFPKKAA